MADDNIRLGDVLVNPPKNQTPTPESPRTPGNFYGAVSDFFTKLDETTLPTVIRSKYTGLKAKYKLGSILTFEDYYEGLFKMKITRQELPEGQWYHSEYYYELQEVDDKGRLGKRKKFVSESWIDKNIVEV